jgi:hypothetical protein
VPCEFAKFFKVVEREALGGSAELCPFDNAIPACDVNTTMVPVLVTCAPDRPDNRWIRLLDERTTMGITKGPGPFSNSSHQDSRY